MEVTVIKDNIHLLMDYFYFLKDLSIGRSLDIIHHLAVEVVEICTEDDVKIHHASEFIHIISAKGIYNVRKRRN